MIVVVESGGSVTIAFAEFNVWRWRLIESIEHEDKHCAHTLEDPSIGSENLQYI